MKGLELLNNPFFNKGSAFTKEEREKFNLNGLLPTKVRTIEEQAKQTYDEFTRKQTNLEKRLFLMEIFSRNRTLFYKLLSDHLVEFMPIIYDPVVAESIEKYNEIFSRPQDAAFLSIDEPNDIEEQLKNVTEDRDIQLIVVTDAEGILGIGDWGVNGVDIVIGKLMVYTAAAGIDPKKVLPVSLDVGTNNENLLNDDLYLGNRHRRITGERYDAFIDKFVKAVQRLYPDALLHWEDFGRDNATKILKKYENEMATFNDDVQGTGIVVLAGILGGLNIAKESLTHQRILIYGAGTAGMGIANILLNEMKEQGLNDKEAKNLFYFVDKQGLLNCYTPNLSDEQKEFINDSTNVQNTSFKSLEEIVSEVQPTILIGTSTQPGAFNEQVVKTMSTYTERPIILPLSNPTKLAEAKAEDLLRWTNGKALIGTGIPVENIQYNGVEYQIGQANNALMYPGLGLGLIASKAQRVNKDILSQASHALGNLVEVDKPGAPILPPISKIENFSQKIAEDVAQAVIDQKLNGSISTYNVKDLVAHYKWQPIYESLLDK